MIKVDENKLVEVIYEAMEKAFRLRIMSTFDWLNYLYEIIQENTLEMNDKDLSKLFGAVESYVDAREKEIKDE